jgi:large subunit ribosomal protein L29
MVELKELRSKTEEELQEHLIELTKEQFTLRMQKSTGLLTQTHLLGQVSRDIARVKTVARESAKEKASS